MTPRIKIPLHWTIQGSGTEPVASLLRKVTVRDVEAILDLLEKRCGLDKEHVAVMLSPRTGRRKYYNPVETGTRERHAICAYCAHLPKLLIRKLTGWTLADGLYARRYEVVGPGLEPAQYLVELDASIVALGMKARPYLREKLKHEMDAMREMYVTTHYTPFDVDGLGVGPGDRVLCLLCPLTIVVDSWDPSKPYPKYHWLEMRDRSIMMSMPLLRLLKTGALDKAAQDAYFRNESNVHEPDEPDESHGSNGSNGNDARAGDDIDDADEPHEPDDAGPAGFGGPARAPG